MLLASSTTKDVDNMGADAIIYLVFMNGILNEGSELRDRERRMITETNEFLTADDIEEYKQNLINYGNFDEDGNELDVPETIKNVIMNFFECIDKRDVTYQFHNGQTIWMTGGMSYGDDPTESSKPFEEFDCLPKRIKEAGGFE